MKKDAQNVLYSSKASLKENTMKEMSSNSLTKSGKTMEGR
jgi:hypothetical protein